MSSTRAGFEVRVGERVHEVEVEIDAAGERRVFVDGQAFEVAQAGRDVRRVSPVSSDLQLEVTLGDGPRPGEASVAGIRVKLELRTTQEVALAASLGKSGDGGGDGSLRAPMPGRVVQVLVAAGEVVERGAPVLIIEAMKMENELHAPVAGVVERVSVVEGEAVDAGQTLLEIEIPSET